MCFIEKERGVRNRKRNSKFFQLIQKAITMNMDNETLSELFYAHEAKLISEKLELNYIDNPPEMERAVRILAILDIALLNRKGTFVVNNCPEEKRKDFEWFVKFFAYLEAITSQWELTENEIDYPAGEDARNVFEDGRVKYIVNIDDLKFLYPEVIVSFN